MSEYVKKTPFGAVSYTHLDVYKRQPLADIKKCKGDIQALNGNM